MSDFVEKAKEEVDRKLEGKRPRREPKIVTAAEWREMKIDCIRDSIEVGVRVLAEKVKGTVPTTEEKQWAKSVIEDLLALVTEI